MPSKRTAGLGKFLTADAVAASNSIEGFKVSTIDVEDLLDERDVEVSDENRQETLAYQQMMTYIQTLHDSADFDYSKGLINALHWMLQGHRHSRRKPAGQWRRAAVYVTDARDPSIAAYTAPHADDVPDLMHELIDWLNTDDQAHPLVRAAIRTFPVGCASISLPTISRPRQCKVAWTVRPGFGPSCQISLRTPAATNGSCPRSTTWRWPAESVDLGMSKPKVSACSRPSGTCATSSWLTCSNPSAAHALAITPLARGSRSKHFASRIRP